MMGDGEAGSGKGRKPISRRDAEKGKGDDGRWRSGKRNTLTSCRLPLAGGWLLGGAYALLCLFALVGCTTRRDLPTDPAVVPVVVPLDIHFDEQAGRVVIAWEYLGVERVDRYRLVRIGPGGIRMFDWITGPVSRSEDVRADVWPMPSVVDGLLNAGDLYSYRVETQNTRQIPAEAGVGDLLVPGTRMEQLAFQEDGTTAVSWHTPGKAPRRHDLFRQMGDAPFALIAQPAIDGDTSFVDHLPRGNVEYRYFMRNELDHGVVLDSRAMVLRPFLYEQTFDAGTLPGAHFLLAPSDGVHSSLLALFAAPDAVVVRQVGVDGVEDDPIGLPFPDYENVNVSSLSFTILPFGFFADPHIFLAGIEPGTQRVRLQAFALRGSAAQPVAWDHAAWPVDDPNATTAMGVGANGEIVVVAEQALRIFSPQGQRIVEVDAWPLGLGSEVRSLSVAPFGVWAVTSDGGVWRSPRVGPSAPVWTTVAFDGDAAWVGTGPRAAFVLDRAQHRVATFNAQGQAGLWWSLDGPAAGLAISPFAGDVYVWDAQHRIALYKNAPPAIQVFLGE